MNIEISQEDFLEWKTLSVTKFIFKYLEEVKQYTLEAMTSKEYLNNPNGLLKLNELRGYVDAIEDFTNLNPVIEDEEQNEENSESTGL